MSKITAIEEWQEQTALLLSLPRELGSDWSSDFKEILHSYLELAKIVCKYQKLILVHEPNCKHLEGFRELENIEFFEFFCDDTWIRDYGPLQVREDNSLLALDWRFCGWGKKFCASKDDAFTKAFCQAFGMKYKSLDIELEGGSIDIGRAFYGESGESGQNSLGKSDAKRQEGSLLLTTSTCLAHENRGSRSMEDLSQTLKSAFGVDEVLALDVDPLNGDDTDAHIDTLARFVAPNTIVYAALPQSHKEHKSYESLKRMKTQLEAMAARFKLKLFPLFLPEDIVHEGKTLPATYLNFIILNKAVILPIYKDTEADNLALCTLQTLMPERVIEVLDARVFIRQGGSLHCASLNLYKEKK